MLLAEVLAAFAELKDGVLVDATLGGAGHARALLEGLPGTRVLGCDRDPAAVEAARANLAEFARAGRFAACHANFAELVDAGAQAGLPEAFKPPWSGILLDLGYSSNQLEDPAYGMSFQVDGPLDMRLSREGQSAWDILYETPAAELADILSAYGEIPGAGRLAVRIKSAIAEGGLTNSTLSLARFISKSSPLARRGREAIHPATLVFQALRIAVNDELRALDHFLNNVTLFLTSGAIVGVITFHSVEDRLVKQWGRAHEAAFEAVTRKPVSGGDDELRSNPRARSAKLRVYRKR